MPWPLVDGSSPVDGCAPAVIPCFGSRLRSALYVRYHHTEWGRPVRDDRRLFEFLVLEAMQAGLSWETVLKRREAYRQALFGFDPKAVAALSAADIDALCRNAALIRHRGKFEAAVTNAAVFLDIQKTFGSFSAYLWAFVDNVPRKNLWNDAVQIPARSKESEALSRDLRRRGMRFFGPVIAYAYMQATGLVNDHLADCPYRG